MSKSREKILLVAFAAIVGTAILKIKTEDFSPGPAAVLSPFIYSFNAPGVLNEAGDMEESSSPYWWVSSGGVMIIKDGVGSTNIGEMNALSKWRLLYRINNPLDTDGGYHPQNIFRLVTRSTWQDFSEQVYFKPTHYYLSDSPNRNATNGALLFSRYEDSNNLYYAGIRVDGTAVIKKKQQGEYFTLAQEQIFDGKYDREDYPNLLPVNTWIGLKTIVRNNLDNSVSIELFLDLDDLYGTANGWRSVLTVKDLSGDSDGDPMLKKSFAGIRTDFMDVEFRDFELTVL